MALLTPDELAARHMGYVVLGSEKYHLLPFDIRDWSGSLVDFCEQLHLSCIPFRSEFNYFRPERDIKYISVENVACASRGEIMIYEKAILLFAEGKGDFIRLETSPQLLIVLNKVLYMSKSRIYMQDYFCDLCRRTEPGLHWLDWDTKDVYEVSPKE